MAHFYFHQHLRFSKRSRAIIDKLMVVAAVLHPLMTLPQVIKIYSTQSAKDLSLLTWVMYFMLGLIFLLYALAHKIKPLIVTQVLWGLMDGAIFIGILLYG